MSIKIENAPSPRVLMKSMRSIGYTFETALADIIDNSISAGAKNIYISVPINDEDVYISILDDGNGMSRDDLFNAMKYGSDREYQINDLGRFGLGLKSASLSQCRILTVISKNEGTITGFQWDFDSVIEDKRWDCIELEQSDIELVPDIEKLKSLEMGTLVIWQNFDIAYKKSNGRIREYISDEVEEAEKHLRLVFHRFLSNRFKPLNIFINNNQLSPIDPFLEDNPKTDSQKVSELSIYGETIKVQPFILPHQSDLQLEDIEKLGGISVQQHDLVVSILQRALTTGGTSDTRRHELLEDLLKENQIIGNGKEVSDVVKSIFSSGEEMTERDIAELKRIGFKIVSESPHYKLVYKDSKYWFTVSKTASDKMRSGKNLMSDITRRLSIYK